MVVYVFVWSVVLGFDLRCFIFLPTNMELLDLGFLKLLKSKL